MISVLFVFTAKFTIYRHTDILSYYIYIQSHIYNYNYNYNTRHFVVAKNGAEFWNWKSKVAKKYFNRPISQSDYKL